MALIEEGPGGRRVHWNRLQSGSYLDHQFVYPLGLRAYGSYRHDADIVQSHQSGRLNHGGLWCDRARLIRHHFADFHRSRSYAGARRSAMGRRPA